MIKSLFVIVSLVFAATAALGEENRHQEMFAKMKQAQVEGLQGRINIMQTALSCVIAATTHEQMKSCHQQEHQAMEAHKQKHEAMRESMKPAANGSRGDNPGGRK